MFNNVFKNVKNVDDWVKHVTDYGASVSSTYQDLLSIVRTNPDDLIKKLTKSGASFSQKDIDFVKESMGYQQFIAGDILNKIDRTVNETGTNVTKSLIHKNLKFSSVIGADEGKISNMFGSLTKDQVQHIVTNTANQVYADLGLKDIPTRININYGTGMGEGDFNLGVRSAYGSIDVNFDEILRQNKAFGGTQEDLVTTIVDDVAHELRHTWQQHFDNANYRRDNDNYINSDVDMDAYKNQGIEVDARQYGADVSEKYAQQYYDEALKQFPNTDAQQYEEGVRGKIQKTKDKILGKYNTVESGNKPSDNVIDDNTTSTKSNLDSNQQQPQQSRPLELPAPREGAPMFEGGAVPEGGTVPEPPKKKSKFGREIERKRRAEERQERIAESLKEENKKEITEKILTSNKDRNKVRARLHELEQAGKIHTKEYRELVALEDKARNNFEELKGAKQQIIDTQFGKDTVLQLPPPQQPINSGQQGGSQRRKGNQPRQSPNPRRAPQPKQQPQPTPQPQPQPQQPSVKQQQKPSPPPQQQTQQQQTPPNQQQQQPYGPPPPPPKNYATVDDSSVIEKMFDGDGYSGNIKNGYVQDITINSETFNIKTNMGDGSIDIFDSTGNLIMDTDLEKQINEKVFDETSKFYKGLTDEEWDTVINNAENFRFNANQASESLLERDAKMLNMNDAVNYRQKVLEEEREAIKKTAENTKGKKNKKKLSDQRNIVDIKWNEAERIKQINKHKLDSNFRRTAARDKFNKTLGLDAYEAGSDEFKQALNALKGTDEYNAAMKVFKKDLKDINTIKKAGIKETNRVIDAKIKGLTGKGLTLSNAITIGSVAVGAVNKYKESRAEGKGMVSSAARAGATAIASEVMGVPATFAVMGARALGNAAVEAGDMLYKESRRMNSMSNFTPLGGVNFQDSQELATMRQSGMELAKMSQYNLEQTLMGAEAKHLHR